MEKTTFHGITVYLFEQIHQVENIYQAFCLTCLMYFGTSSKLSIPLRYSFKVSDIIIYSVVCTNFGRPALTSSFQVYALCSAAVWPCYENHHSKAETISKLTFHSQLLQNYFSPGKLYDSVKRRSQGMVSEVRAHYPIQYTHIIHSTSVILLYSTSSRAPMYILCLCIYLFSIPPAMHSPYIAQLDQFIRWGHSNIPAIS